MIEALQSKLIPLFKKLLIVVLLVLVAIAAYNIIHRTHPLNKQIVTSLVKTTEYKEGGITHEVIKVRELTQDEIDHITDSLKRTIKGHPQIKEVIKYVPTVDTQWRDLPVVIQGDTVETSKVDSYVTAYAIINTRTKQGLIELKLTDTLTAVKTVKKRLLGSSTSTIDITNANPYVHIASGYSISGIEPKSTVVLGPYVGYDFINMKPSIGICATFNLLSIKSKK